MIFPSDKTIIIGHRGCRGLIPENTIEGFLRAVDVGVDALKLDVVIPGDQVLISHEPWLNNEICLDQMEMKWLLRQQALICFS